MQTFGIQNTVVIEEVTEGSSGADGYLLTVDAPPPHKYIVWSIILVYVNMGLGASIYCMLVWGGAVRDA